MNLSASRPSGAARPTRPRPIDTPHLLLRLSLLRFVDSSFPGSPLMDMRIPPLKIKIYASMTRMRIPPLKREIYASMTRERIPGSPLMDMRFHPLEREFHPLWT